MLERAMLVLVILAIVAIDFVVWSLCKVASEADKKSMEMIKMTKKQ